MITRSGKKVPPATWLECVRGCGTYQGATFRADVITVQQEEEKSHQRQLAFWGLSGPSSPPSPGQSKMTQRLGRTTVRGRGTRGGLWKDWMWARRGRGAETGFLQVTGCRRIVGRDELPHQYSVRGLRLPGAASFHRHLVQPERSCFQARDQNTNPKVCVSAASSGAARTLRTSIVRRRRPCRSPRSVRST